LVRDTREAAHRYFQKYHIPFPCLVDIDGRVYRQYEVKSTLLSLGQRPALFVIDREGIVRYAYLGSQQLEIPSNNDVLEVCRSIPCKESV
jgi:peroxiredoxin